MGADVQRPEALDGGGWLLLGAEMDAIWRAPLGDGTWVVYSHGAPHKEPGGNEDGVLVVPCDGGSAVLALADGVGGRAGGHLAAREALRALARASRTARRGERPLRDVILDGFEAANARVRALPGSAATTLVVAELGGGRVRIYHAGDSVAVVMGQRGRIKHWTKAHSPVGYAVEAGVLDEQDAMTHEDRHVICNALGGVDMHIEVGPSITLAPRDTLLLASDGLFDNLLPDEIVAHLRKGPLPDAVAGLAARCRARMAEGDEGRPCKPDDLTLLAWRRA